MKKISRITELAVEIVVALALVGALVAYVMSSFRMPISRNWVGFVGITLIVFWNLVTFTRKFRNGAATWWVLAVAFALHVAAGCVACAYMQEIPLVWFVVVGIAEVSIILGILQRMPTPEKPVSTE